MPISQITSASIATNTITSDDMSSTAQYYGFKNRIINGAMGIWQRATSYTGTPSVVAYGSVDRWAFYSTASITASQSSDVPTGQGFKYSLKIQRPAAATSTNQIYTVQVIESNNMLDLAGQTVTISFWAKAGANFSAASSILNVNVNSGTVADQGSGSSLGGWTGATTPVNAFPTLTTTWTRYSYTGTIPSSSLEISVAFYYTPSGTAGADDSFFITGVQLEKGSVATSFDFRPIGTELMLCQRYYFNDTYTVSSGLARRLVAGYMYSSTQWEGMYFYPVEMRVAPTITFTAANTFTINGALTVSSVSGYLPNTRSTLLYTGNSAGTVGQGAGLWTTATNGTVSNIQ